MIKNFIFIGPPGCGKGTQSMLLSRELGCARLATGELFRKLAQENNKFAEKIKITLAKGELVSDELVNKVIDDFYNEIKNNQKVILDGYPRNMSQAMEMDKILQKHNSEVNEVFYFDVSDDVLIKRILGRYTCDDCGEIYNEFYYSTKVEGSCDKCKSSNFSRRDDDSKEVLLNRLNVFRNTTKPLLEYYEKKLININAEESTDKVSKQILKFLV